MRPRDLGIGLRSEKSRLSHQLRRMESRGLVDRAVCDEDARGALVAATAAGRTAYGGEPVRGSPRSCTPGSAVSSTAQSRDGAGDAERRVLTPSTPTRSAPPPVPTASGSPQLGHLHGDEHRRAAARVGPPQRGDVAVVAALADPDVPSVNPRRRVGSYATQLPHHHWAQEWLSPYGPVGLAGTGVE